MKPRKLSERQRRMLAFIADFIEENSYPPTVRDICRACDISSTSVVDYNLRILTQRGHIRRQPEVSRGIELIGHRLREERVVSIPILGQIAAGQPIPVPSADAWTSDDFGEALEVSKELVGAKRQVYALRVKGTSMIDALIGDGDYVLMEPAHAVEDGDTVAVWLSDEKETTLKRIYREGSRLRLQPANESMSPIYVDPTKAEIQGRVVGVIRLLTR